MKIEKVELKNFQSHKHTVIEFDKDFNVLVGSSNSGKSSVLRAIMWCFTNQPAGKDFIRKGEKEASVTVTLDNDIAIERTRGTGSSNNYYRIFKGGELLEEYTGFGSGVPSEVENIVGDRELLTYAFADQMESPYLISETPRKRAEMIGNLEDFAKLDLAISEIKSDERDLRKYERESKASITELKKTLEEVHQEKEKVVPLFNQVDKIYEELQMKMQSVDRLNAIHQRLLTIAGEVKGYNDVLYKATKVTQAYEGLDDMVNRHKKLHSVVDQLRYKQKEIKDLESLTFIETEKAEKKIAEIEKLISEFEKKESVYKQAANVERRKEDIPTFSEVATAIDVNTIELMIERFKQLTIINDGLLSIHKKKEEAKAVVSSVSGNIEKQLDLFVKEITETEMCPTCLQDTTSVDKELIKKNL